MKDPVPVLRIALRKKAVPRFQRKVLPLSRSVVYVTELRKPRVFKHLQLKEE